MNETVLNIGLVAVFTLFGGIFASAELALVSLREGQIKALRERGRRGRVTADLASEPNRFLSAVQIGVTLAGFLSAAFGGATLADDLAPVLEGIGIPPGASATVALVVVTIIISYFSIVFAELTAKRIALQRTVGVAYVLGPFIHRVSQMARPVIWLLSVSTDVVVRLVGGDPNAAREEMSDEELRQLLSSHETLSEDEKRIVDDVFTAGDRQVREVMVPRPDVDFLEGALPARAAADLALESPRSRYPVIGSSADDVLGFVHVRDLLRPEVYGSTQRVRELTRSALMIPDTRDLLSAMSDMRQQGAHLAIVVDEYGGTAGIVTLEDLVEEIVGDIKDEYDQEEEGSTRLITGETEVDGRLNLEDFADETGVVLDEGPYETVAGYVIARLGHLPEVGEECLVDTPEGQRLLHVAAVDGRRVARVRVSLPPTSGDDPEDGTSDRDADRRDDAGDDAGEGDDAGADAPTQGRG